LLSFNFIAIPVSMGGMVESLDVPPTDVGTAIVMLSLGVSAFILLGARLGQWFGARLMFQVAVLCFGGAMVVVVLSPSASVLIAAQSLAGLAAAVLVPALVMLIASHYRGQQRAEALGWVGSAGAMASVLAFVIGGLADT